MPRLASLDMEGPKKDLTISPVTIMTLYMILTMIHITISFSNHTKEPPQIVIVEPCMINPNST